jgi:hypothetical protein
LVLAFLAASTLARNSDFWFHLASGQRLAHGQLSFSDPFAYTSGHPYWASHSWLFDLGLYVLYGLIGGAGLVAAKALVMTALAALLLAVRVPGRGAGLPVVCTTLALLAVIPRLFLQPACLSYFFLALTFWLLWRRQQSIRLGVRSERRDKGSLASLLVLVAVFAVWANVDEWFFMGPLLVGLFWLGGRLEGRRHTPGWLVVAGLAASFLNPYPLHLLPSELSPTTWSSGLRQDPRFQGLFASPWQLTYLLAAAGLNAAALAYYLLVVLGIVSFMAYRPALRGWRLVVWLPFALLAAWQVRAVPFFAVVAAPITVLNGQDLVALLVARRKPIGEHQQSSEGDRAPSLVRLPPQPIIFWSPYLLFLLCLGLLCLIALTWPGWLEGRGREGRRIAWGVQADPSLQRVVETLQHWHRQGLVADSARVFATAPEVAHYAAWFSPGEKQFLDHRYELFPEAAHDFETVCRALLPGLTPAASQPTDDWRKVLGKNQVGIVVFYDRDPQRLFGVLTRIAGDPQHWTLLGLPGQAIIAGWNESPAQIDCSRLTFDAEGLAFDNGREGRPHDLPGAPDQGPEQLPGPGDYWVRMARPVPQNAWESTAATLYLYYFQGSEPLERQREMASALSSYAAGLAGLPGLSPAVPAVSLELSLAANVLFGQKRSDTFLVRDQLGPFFAHLVDRSPALPLLAVRAARRAVAANPEDANAWVRLGQAYLILRSATCEHSAEALFPPLTELRQIQVLSALEQALRLDPDLEPVHRELAYLYGEHNALDQALAHRLEEMRLTQRSGARPGETDEELADRLELLDRDTAKLEEAVRKRREAYNAGAATLEGNRLKEAEMALRLGLPQQAADKILLTTDLSTDARLLGGAAGLKLELDLLLKLGRLQDVRPILNDPDVSRHRGNLLFYDIPPPPNPTRTAGNDGRAPPKATPEARPSTRSNDGSALHALPYHWPAYEWLRVLEAASAGDYGQARESLRIIRGGLAAGQERLRRQLPALENGEWRLIPGVLSGAGVAAPPPFLPLGMVAGLAHFLEQKKSLQTGEQGLRAQLADLCVIEALVDLEQGAVDEARTLFGEAQRLGGQSPAAAFAGAPIAAGYLARLNGAK